MVEVGLRGRKRERLECTKSLFCRKRPKSRQSQERIPGVMIWFEIYHVRDKKRRIRVGSVQLIGNGKHFSCSTFERFFFAKFLECSCRLYTHVADRCHFHLRFDALTRRLPKLPSVAQEVVQWN